MCWTSKLSHCEGAAGIHPSIWGLWEWCTKWWQYTHIFHTAFCAPIGASRYSTARRTTVGHFVLVLPIIVKRVHRTARSGSVRNPSTLIAVATTLLHIARAQSLNPRKVHVAAIGPLPTSNVVTGRRALTLKSASGTDSAAASSGSLRVSTQIRASAGNSSLD